MNDVSRLTDYGIYQRTLADIRATHNGYLGNSFVFVLETLLRFEVLDNLIQQLSRSGTVYCGYGINITQAQGIEFHMIVGPQSIVSLIRSQDNLLIRSSEHIGHILIARSQSVFDIDHEYDDIRLLYCKLNLLAYLPLERIIASHYVTAGVDHGKLLAVPCTLTIMAVSRNSCLGMYYCISRFGKTIEQSRFSHVGSSHYRYNISHKIHI